MSLKLRQLLDREVWFKGDSCDETWTPLLDQGLVEASGSLALLTFALER